MGAKHLKEESEALHVACVIPSTAWKPTLSTAEHEAVIKAMVPRAEELESVSKPDRPIANVLEEGFTFVRTAREVRIDLEAVGLRHGVIDEYEGCLFALMSSNVLTAGLRANRRTEAEKRAVSEGRAVLVDAGAAARLALRGTPAAERVAALLAEKEEAQLHPGMNELAHIVLAAEPAFAAKHVDARELAEALVAAAERVRVAVSDEGAARRLSEGTDMRDRLYTLAMGCLDEIRVHADYAFRSDRSGRRQLLFASEYTRARGRRYQNKKKGEAERSGPEPVSEDGTERK